MNKKLFGRDGRQAQLEDLYRAAERGDALPDVDAQLHKEFAADQQLRQQLGRLASRTAPAAPDIGRAAFLAAVARQRNQLLEEEHRPMIGKLVGARGLALLAVAGIFAGGAVTVGASGGVGNAAGNANDVLATLHVPHKGHGHGHANPNAGGGEPDDSGAPAEDGQRAIEGIPTENPQHHPADADGTCDKGETIVKTVPSGIAVNVPCQTAEDHGQGNGAENRGADKVPGAKATEASDHSDDAEHTPVPLPTQANEHAPERGDNGAGH